MRVQRQNSGRENRKIIYRPKISLPLEVTNF